jgi:hypothetical protein
MICCSAASDQKVFIQGSMVNPVTLILGTSSCYPCPRFEFYETSHNLDICPTAGNNSDCWVVVDLDWRWWCDAVQVVLRAYSCTEGITGLSYSYSVMGPFPLIIDILKFRLIDSIVKSKGFVELLTYASSIHQIMNFCPIHRTQGTMRIS